MDFLLDGIMSITWQQVVMYGVGALLIYLAIAKEVEPALLLPMGFGAILVNLPFSGVLGDAGIIQWLFTVGIEASEAFPLLLFIGIGAMIDFEPLLAKPYYFLLGAAAQFGIFAALLLARVLGFDLPDAASIGIIGAADGPTAILVAQKLNSAYMGQIAVVAYSYMALVPIVQPLAIKLVTTKKERRIHMPAQGLKADGTLAKPITKKTKILFPIMVTLLAGLVAPDSISLVGFLMFGNLIRECGVLRSLSETAQTTLTNLITLLLGITISFSMVADKFVRPETLIILLIGLAAFVFDTIGGVLFAKLLNLFLPHKINPMIGAAGISAFPMSARVVQKMAQKEDPTNILLMDAVGANVAGQIASVVAGGLILWLVK